ncbi:MAG: acyl-CoA thioesterase [Phototrophicales bacterium]|nr:MAG: acyl-CoA thioesterase [Phototrophicales bacterium]
MDAKTPSLSAVTLARLMGPQDANSLGNVHGGVIMKMVDEAGALAAMRHAGGPVVTVRMDSMTFRKPIFVGQLVTIHAELTYAGRTSMEVRVEVQAENPFVVGDITHTNSAYVVFVAIDEHGRPRPVPPLEPENDIQRFRMEQAQQRQAFRIQQQREESAAVEEQSQRKEHE